MIEENKVTNKRHSWSEEETRFLKHLFHNIPFNKKISKFGLIHKQFELKNYNKTKKAIEKKSYRLELINYKMNLTRVKIKCMSCDNKFMIPQRTLNMYKKVRCDVCKEIKRKSWNMSENGKAYHKTYNKEYNLKKKVN